MSKLVQSLALMSALVATPMLATANPCQNGSIEVEGYGEVLVLPDVATLGFNVKNEQKDAKVAKANVEKSVAAFIAKLENLKLNKDAVNASEFSMYSTFEYKNSKRIFTGYQVSREVKVTVNDFALIDKVIAAAIDANITDIYGFSYDISNKAKFQEQATLKAIEDAKVKAQVLAKGFNLKVTKPCSIKYGNQGGFISPQVRALQASAMDNSQGVVDYSPKKQTISSQVIVTYGFE